MDYEKIKKCILSVFVVFLLIAGFACTKYSEALSVGDDMMMGLPFGGEDDAGLDLCPEGASVIGMFINAWGKGDYKTMYDLIDAGSKIDYPFDEAKFDFQFLEKKDYKISSVRENGENFEFILSSGDYRDGDKDVKKMIISGKTFRIIMPTKRSPFKESTDSYF